MRNNQNASLVLPRLRPIGKTPLGMQMATKEGAGRSASRPGRPGNVGALPKDARLAGLRVLGRQRRSATPAKK